MIKTKTITTLAKGSICAALVGLMANTGAYAGMGGQDEWQLDTTLTANYGVSVRAKDPADELLVPSNANGDDGNRNFKKGIVSNRLSFIGDLDLYFGRTGFFGRVTGFYDAVYHKSNDNNSPFTVNKSGTYNEFTSKTQDYMGDRLRVLDAYFYTQQPLGDSSQIDIRLGNQVVQWGESMFFPNVAGAQSPVDANKANLPGITVKDILLPALQMAVQLDIGTNVSLKSYYQFRWAETEIPPVGSYFSYADVVGPGAQVLLLAPPDKLTRGADITPKNAGQGGLGLTWRVTDITELGFYYLQYHAKTPMLDLNFVTGSYQFHYLEDLKMAATSITTQLWGVNFAGEISLTQDMPFLVKPGGYKRGDLLQAQVNFLYVLGPNFLADSTALVGELVYVSADNLEGKGTRLLNDDTAAALQLSATPSFQTLIPGWNIEIPINFTMMVNGDVPPASTLGVLTSKKDKRFSIGANFTRLGNLQLGVSYSAFLGKADPIKVPLADRDYYAMNVKYSF